MTPSELVFSQASQMDLHEGFFGNDAVDSNAVDSLADSRLVADWLETVTKIKNSVLGDSYQLTINWVSEDEITTLNKDWRSIDSPTDVLSFPYSSDEGELFLCPTIIESKYQLYERDLPNFVLFLFVHSLHHLAGLDHGSEMESAEEKTRREFLI